MSARIKFTYYLDVISSWCFYAEPMIAELKERYADDLEYQWKVALIDESGIPTSREQEDWFYRRSGLLVRWPYMLNSGWYDASLKEYLAPNLVAEAAKEFGIIDDRARLAIAKAGMIDGEKVGDLRVSVQAASNATGIAAQELREVAESPAIEKRCRESTAEFLDLKINQRPGFLIESDIGDRAVFSGLIHDVPLFATIDAMIDHSMGYQTHKAHFGDPPK